MNRNRLLSAMLFVSASFCILLLLMQLSLITILVHWHVAPDFYSEIKLTIPAFFKIIRMETTSVGETLIQTPTTLSNISGLSFYLLFLQLSAILLLTLAAVREFMTVIRSVKQIKTFVSSNIESFRKIGFRFFLVFVLSSFHIMKFGDTIMYGVYIHFAPILIAMLSYTLSEIFKEGNALLEENKGTI